MSSIIFSPRAVNFTHGSGAQLSYFQEFFPEQVRLINFGGREYGVGDSAVGMESKVVSCWPFAFRGRRMWNRLCTRLGAGYWIGNQVSPRGIQFLNRQLCSCGATAALVIIDSESSASRFNSIRSHLKLPYQVILYDLIDPGPIGQQHLPNVASAICGADLVYAISDPLASVAASLGASDIARIGFYRPEKDVSAVSRAATETDRLKIFVSGNAAAGPFGEGLRVLTAMRNDGDIKEFEVHYVGNPLPDDFRRRLDAEVFIDHGILNRCDRDAIGQACDFAFLAGPADDPATCFLARFSVPSKIGDFAVLGLPVVARFAVGSAAEQFVRSEVSSFVRVATDIGQLRISLKQIANDGAERSRMAILARKYAEEKILLPDAAAWFFN